MRFSYPISSTANGRKYFFLLRRRNELGLRRLFLYVGQGFSLATVCTRNRATLKGRPTTALKFLYIELGLSAAFFCTQGHGHRVPTLKFLYIELGIRQLKTCRGRSRLLTAIGNARRCACAGRQQELAPTNNFEIPKRKR